MIYFPQLTLFPSFIQCLRFSSHTISQYPFFGEPCRTSIPHFLSFLILASIFLLEMPIISAIFFAESRVSFDNSSSICFCVPLKSSLESPCCFSIVFSLFLRCFSNASPMFLRCFFNIFLFFQRKNISKKIHSKHVIKHLKTWSRKSIVSGGA